MADIIGYTESNMKPFETTSFNAVDSLVLSTLAYIRYENIVPSLSDKGKPVKLADLVRAELFGSMFGNIRDTDSHRRLFFAIAASPRFRDARLNYCTSISDPVLDKQFCAVTFLLNDHMAFIAYRGTDATFIGWKEDFNMAYMSPIPAQEEGVRYLNAVAREIPSVKELRVGGHSKGGNIAVYSAVKCDPAIQERIAQVYNHDGPGFKENLFESKEFLGMQNKIHTTLPEESLIGMLMQHHEDYHVIKCSQHGVMQHNPFCWTVEQDDFSYVQKLRNSALIRSASLNECLNTISDEKRKIVIDALFELLKKTEYESFRELSVEWQKKAAPMLSLLRDTDPEVRKIIIQTMNELAQVSVKNLFKQIKMQ